MARIYNYKNKNGKFTWFVDYVYKGIRYRKKIGTSKRLAELTLKEIEVDIAKGQFDSSPDEISIIDFFKIYEEYSSVNHNKESQRRYVNIITNFLTYIKGKKRIKYLSDLQPEIFENYKIFRRKVPLNKGIIAKTNTVNMEIKTLRTILNYAIKMKFLKENPTNDVKKLKVIDAKKPRFLTIEEIDTLLENCGKDLYPIFYTFINTGMRLGELLNLTWSDVDFNLRKINIRAKEFWTPKSGERSIPLNIGTYDLLKEIKSKTKEKVFVFSGKNGGKLTIKLRERLKTITKRCGFPDVTKIHTFRHTFASHLVMKGVDLPTVQKLLGHSDIQTTMIYSHLTSDHLVDAVDKLNFKKLEKSS